MLDLDERAIENFRKRWAQKARREDYLTFSDEKMLRAIGLLTDKGLNYACLILFGKKEKIDELIPCSEIVFEWRQDARKISHDFRINWREPFLKFMMKYGKRLMPEISAFHFKKDFSNVRYMLLAKSQFVKHCSMQ